MSSAKQGNTKQSRTKQAFKPRVLIFLWTYFRGYLGWLGMSLFTTLVYALSTVLLLALFRPILSEVLLADEGLTAGITVTEEASEEGAADGLFGMDIDLQQMFENAFLAVKASFGINSENIVVFLPLLFAAVFLVRSLAGFGNGYLFQLIGLGATNDLRNGLYARILSQSSNFYAEHPSGELVSRVGNDISVMQNAISSRLLDLFQQSITLVFLIWYLLSIHLELALICLVAVPAIAYPIAKFGKSMRRASKKSQERLADFSNLVAEAVRGHRVVKAFSMEKFELDRFRKATDRHLRVRLRAQLLSYGSGPVVESIGAIGAALFLIWAGRAVRAAELTPSELVTFLTNLVMLYEPIRKLNKVNLILQEALAAGERVVDVMEIPNEIENRPGAVILPTDLDGPGEIRFEGVRFAYDNEPVLRGLDLVIKPGEIVALVGSSGAGKSTLVNLLPRYFDPDEGKVTMGGVDLRDLQLESLRSQIGIVTQDTVLFNDSIRNNIAYGRSDLSLEAVREAARAAYADEFVMESPEGYEAEIGESGLKLSGGQRQRLAIARALVKNPPILILDEATSHLDSESEALVQKALYNLMEGRTALVIAHRLSTIKRADRILVMDAGKVIEEGVHEELLQRGGQYQRLYELQFQE